MADRMILDEECGCSCDRSKCGQDICEQNLLDANGACAWPQCEKKGRPKDSSYRGLHLFQCHCDEEKLPIHFHLVPRYFCRTKCERKWRGSKYDKWKQGSNPNLDEEFVFGKRSEAEKQGRPACKNCEAVEPIDRKYQTCGRCRNALYCTASCQKKDWKRHRASSCEPRSRNDRNEEPDDNPISSTLSSSSCSSSSS